MPEFPDVAFFRKYLEKHALKRSIQCVEVKHPRILRDVLAAELERELTGREFTATRQHGKYLFARIAEGEWLLMHFGMTGYLEYFEKPEDDPKYDRFLLGFSGGGFLAYVNQRMLGWIGLTGNPDDLIRSRGLGPSVLDPTFDYRAFRERLSGKKGEVKPTLMDQGVLAGIGNVYSDEILLQACIHPKTKVNELSERQLKSIYDTTKRVLLTAVEHDADPATFPAGYLLRDRRKGAKCPQCGAKLQTAKVGGRTACFCPSCQGR